MIHTITFNPALDVSGTVDSIIPDEKCYVHDEVYAPGGNGINAGVIAKRLGGKVLLSGFLGGANGNRIKSLLNDQNMHHHFISIKSNSRMNITVSSRKTHKQTRLSFTGPKISEKDWKQLLLHIKKIRPGKDLVIIGGSLPPGISIFKVKSLITFFRSKGIYCMVDMPPKFLKQIIDSRPSFIKPNLEEFQEFTGRKVSKISEVLKLMKSYLHKVPLICVSSVEGGAILANEKEAWFGKTPKLNIHSTVGAGDSMVGAMATLLVSDPNVELANLLRIGLAASSATLSESGLILGSERSILRFKSKIKLRKISISKDKKWKQN